MTYRKLPSNCNIVRGEQGATEFNNMVVACWLNILCKRGGVSNGVISIAIRATLTSRSCLPAFHLPKFIDPENRPANSQYLNPVDFSMWGALHRSCIVRSSETLSGQCKRTDRPTAKNTDHGD